MILGPLTGSLLFNQGGYSLPFYVMAGLLLLAAATAFFALEADDEIVRSAYANMDGAHANINEAGIEGEIDNEASERNAIKVLLSRVLILEMKKK